MTRAERIAAIIQQRQPLVSHISQVESNLRSLASKLRQIEDQRRQLLPKVNDLEVSHRLEDLNLSALESEIDAEIGALSKLKARFGRKTLNIGVVGRAGQGKSRLLQSLSGLSSVEIPSGDGSHCTGVRSTVYHKAVDQPYGEIWFHTERSFLDKVIQPYYETLHLGRKPATVDEFADNPLPPLSDDGKSSSRAMYGAMYEHLKMYHKHFSEYRHLLEQTLPLRIPKEQIREYVAQNTSDGKACFKFLAVKEAQITCKFPNADVGQIALIDMPGLGNTSLDDDRRMVEILGKDVDVVLFVRMGRPPGDFIGDVDVELYDTAKSALIDLPIACWSFMVLNRTSANSPTGDNFKYCEILREQLPSKHIEVVDCITVNCSDGEEVNQKLLDRILDYLDREITSIDEQYAGACQNRLMQLQQKINAELLKAKSALGHESQNAEWYPLFQKLFRELWEDLTGGLHKLLAELQGQRDMQDIDFREQMKEALETCRKDTGIPSIEEIEKRRYVEGAFGIAYEKYLHEVRAHLSQHFLKLDDGLKRSLNQTKEAVVEVLVHQGRLGNLTTVRGAEFLEAIATQIPEYLKQIKLGFQVIADFELSYRGLIQHRIRRHLDRLTPDTTSLKLSDNPSELQVLQNLETLYAEALYDCEEALEEVLSEPSQAAYAIVEEFVDRVLRARGAEDEWKVLLAEVRSDVWSVDFQELGDRTRSRRQWLDAVEAATNTNHPYAMQFLTTA